MSTLVALGLLALVAAGGGIGWRLARRRGVSVEAELRGELEAMRKRVEAQQLAHEATMRETMAAALRAIRRLGGE